MSHIGFPISYIGFRFWSPGPGPNAAQCAPPANGRWAPFRSLVAPQGVSPSLLLSRPPSCLARRETPTASEIALQKKPRLLFERVANFDLSPSSAHCSVRSLICCDTTRGVGELSVEPVAVDHEVNKCLWLLQLCSFLALLFAGLLRRALLPVS